MLGYWKWLYKGLRLSVKTNLAKILGCFGFDLLIAIGITAIVAMKISNVVAIIVLIINLVLLIGHMLYLMVEVY